MSLAGPPGAEGPAGEAALPAADRRSRAIAIAAAAFLAAAAFWALPPAAAALAALAAAAALWATVIDLERFEIPDGASLAIGATGIGFAVAGGAHAPEPTLADLAVLLARLPAPPADWTRAADATGRLAVAAAAVGDALARAAVVLAILRALQLGYRRLRGAEGFGTGDVKLAAALATWLAWDELDTALTVAVAAALVAVVIAALRRGRAVAATPIPFGAFLALATIGVAAVRIAG